MGRPFPISFEFSQASGQLNWGLRYCGFLLAKRKAISYLTAVAKSMLLPLVQTMEKMRYKEESISCTFQPTSKSPKCINIGTVVLGQIKDLFVLVSFLQMHPKLCLWREHETFPPVHSPSCLWFKCVLLQSLHSHHNLFSSHKWSYIPQSLRFLNSCGLWSSLL